MLPTLVYKSLSPSSYPWSAPNHFGLELPHSNGFFVQIKKKSIKRNKDEKDKKESSKGKIEKKQTDNSKISEFDLINQDHSLKSFEWCIKRRNEHFKNQLHFPGVDQLQKTILHLSTFSWEFNFIRTSPDSQNYFNCFY